MTLGHGEYLVLRVRAGALTVSLPCTLQTTTGDPMKRRSQSAQVATILGAALSATLLSACGGGDSTSAASGKAPAGLLEAGQLSVCTDPEYPPMEYLEN